MLDIFRQNYRIYITFTAILKYDHSYIIICNFLTPWLRSTEPSCLHSDEVKHNHILPENKDIWRRLRPSTAMFGHNELPLFSCNIPWYNATVSTANI